MVKEQKDMKIPTELIPKCSVCGAPMTMNLRCDMTFVQDEDGMRLRNDIRNFWRSIGDSMFCFLNWEWEEIPQRSSNIRSGR